MFAALALFWAQILFAALVALIFLTVVILIVVVVIILIVVLVIVVIVALVVVVVTFTALVVLLATLAILILTALAVVVLVTLSVLVAATVAGGVVSPVTAAHLGSWVILVALMVCGGFLCSWGLVPTAFQGCGGGFWGGMAAPQGVLGWDWGMEAPAVLVHFRGAMVMPLFSSTTSVL
jgi:hypothetical protein